MSGSEGFQWPVGSYDPDEPLIVRYGDLIGARNAVAQLINVLTEQDNPPSEYRAQMIRMCLAAGVEPSEPGLELSTLDEAVRWLAALRERIGTCLPFPAE